MNRQQRSLVQQSLDLEAGVSNKNTEIYANKYSKSAKRPLFQLRTVCVIHANKIALLCTVVFVVTVFVYAYSLGRPSRAEQAANIAHQVNLPTFDSNTDAKADKHADNIHSDADRHTLIKEFANLPSYPFKTPHDLPAVNRYLETKNLAEVLKWVHFATANWFQMTSFGPSGQVILDTLHEIGLLDTRQKRGVAVLTIDTLHLFPETYQHMKKTERFYPGLKIKRYQPKGFTTREAFDAEHGADLWKTDHEKYASLSKVEPTFRALKETSADAWITGRRRDQGGERKDLEIVEMEESGRLKINPLAFWTNAEVWDYINTNGVPYNSLHDEGFASIGDEMTTHKTEPGGGERSGRFKEVGQTECGMHTQMEKLRKLEEAAKADNKEFVRPTLKCAKCYEIDPKKFDEQVFEQDVDILLEFYSPMCGHCQDFAPAYEKLAELYSTDKNILIARQDITCKDCKPPKSAEAHGLDVKSFPSVYFIQGKTKFKTNPLGASRVLKFTHEKSLPAIREWLVDRHHPVPAEAPFIEEVPPVKPLQVHQPPPKLNKPPPKLNKPPPVASLHAVPPLPPLLPPHKAPPEIHPPAAHHRARDDLNDHRHHNPHPQEKILHEERNRAFDIAHPRHAARDLPIPPPPLRDARALPHPGDTRAPPHPGDARAPLHPGDALHMQPPPIAREV